LEHEKKVTKMLNTIIREKVTGFILKLKIRIEG
jgi:hypothetical protein